MGAAAAAPEAQEAAQEAPEGDGKKKHLSNDERNAVLQALLARSDGNRNLNFGAINAVAKDFGRSRQCIAGIWKRGMESLAHGSAMVVDHRKKNCGRKKKDHSARLETMTNIPLKDRSTIRSTAHAMSISTWAVWKMTNNGKY